MYAQRYFLMLGTALLVVVLLTCFVGNPSFAQCIPDGLDQGPCCTPAQVSLPGFPAITQTIRFICFEECFARINAEACVDVGAPQPAAFNGNLIGGVYLIRFTIRSCGPNRQVLWSGTMRAHYDRNWLETNPAGVQLGVWRFLLNGDLVPSTYLVNRFGANRCAVPRCRVPFARVYFSGYIDYALDCQLGQWQAAWALNHDCDSITHNASSARPGNFHADQSFSFVAPSAGFVVSSTSGPVRAGAITGAFVRFNDWRTLPNILRFPEAVRQGAFSPTQDLCPCTTTGSGGPQYTQSAVSGSGDCNTLFTTLPNGPISFFRKAIGQWTNPATFPGLESLGIDQGTLSYTNGCTATQSTEYFDGVETLGGFPARRYDGTPLAAAFVDLGSANRPNGATIIGAPHVSSYLLADAGGAQDREDRTKTIEVKYLWLKGPAVGGAGSGIDSMRNPTAVGAAQTHDCIVKCLNSVYLGPTNVRFTKKDLECITVPADLDTPPDGTADLDANGSLDVDELRKLRTWLYDHTHVPGNMIAVASVGDLAGINGGTFGIPPDTDNLCFIDDHGDCRTYAHEVAHAFGLGHNNCANNIQLDPGTTAEMPAEVPIPPVAQCGGTTASPDVGFKPAQRDQVRVKACDPQQLHRASGFILGDGIVVIACEPDQTRFQFSMDGWVVAHLGIYRSEGQLRAIVTRTGRLACVGSHIRAVGRAAAQFACGSSTITITRQGRVLLWSDGLHSGTLSRIR